MVETEKKYYCMEPDKLIRIAKKEGFKETKKTFETDEYFTDIEGKFIVNRTCLRIRKLDNDKMEITFKGKSNSFTSKYCKVEDNILVDASLYNDFVNLFSSLGYYSYVKVEKERLVYELVKNEYKYSVMIDKLPEIGGFAEFEILSEIDSSNKVELEDALDNFVSKFSGLNLEEATRPYRDIVADYVFNSLNVVNASDICIDVDKEIDSYERDFFKKYKDEISRVYGFNIKWEDYKEGKLKENKLEDLINDYFEKIIFDSSNVLVLFELIKKLKYNVHFITNVNEHFMTCLFKKLGEERFDIISLGGEQVEDVLIRKDVDLESSIIISDKDIKHINSLLLIILNSKERL